MMVAPALIVASYNMPGAPQEWQQLPPESAALLVEFGGADDAELDAAEAKAAEVIAGRELISEPVFARDPETVELNWRVREGLHGLLGKMRPEGSSLIIEDVCVPPARIADSAEDIRALLGEHGFLTGVAGHTSAGNLHFMLTPDFTKPEDLERYEKFMEGLVELILDKYDGSLKAEHGTGINMAPYVEREWGAKATELMWRIKELADPDGVLNPGVLLNRDPGVHLQNLKSTPLIEEVANACVECGFCEPVCPSRNLTTTPRQRIVLRREMARQPAESPVREALIAEYEYDAVETCAADGSCALSCPVGIDTGKLIKDLRAKRRRRARSAGRSRPPSAGRRSSGSAAPGCGSAAGRRSSASGAKGCRRRRASCPGPSAKAPSRSTCPRASTGSLATRAAAAAGSRCPRRWSRSQPAPGCPSGSPTTPPGTAAARRSTRRANPTLTRGWPLTQPRPCGAGARRARSRS